MRFIIAFSAVDGEQAHRVNGQVEEYAEAIQAMPMPEACLDAAHRIVNRIASVDIDASDAELLAGFILELS